METGIITLKCIRCEKTREETFPFTEHYWEVQDGNYTVLTCNYCGLKKTGYGNKGPAGGYIFYDCDADNDSGNADGLKSSECGWRYLEAASEDLPEEYVWGDDGSFGTKEGIGEGRNNTNIIVNKASNERKDNAAMACVMYAEGGFLDWFLPSKDELDLMYKNLKMSGICNFKDGRYWSGSESSNYYAWIQDFSSDSFSSGSQYNSYSRYKSYCVRPIRVFK